VPKDRIVLSSAALKDVYERIDRSKGEEKKEEGSEGMKRREQSKTPEHFRG